MRFICLFVFKKRSKADQSGVDDDSDSRNLDATTVQTFTTFWFVGLQIKPNVEGAVDLDLTEPIQDFTDRVYQQAHKVGIIEPSLDAKYVKRYVNQMIFLLLTENFNFFRKFLFFIRSKLKEYLPLSILKLESKKVYFDYM